jgi:nicotinamidase-related amidase
MAVHKAVDQLTTLEALRIDPADTVLLIVDVQTKLSAVMPEAEMARVERNILVLLEMARRLHFPVIWSEQYPQGLGPTVPALATALAAPELVLTRLEKVTFSVTDHSRFQAAYTRIGRSRYVVVGMEAHVCVWQTARGLRALGAHVFVPADAVISRDPANRAVGLELAARAGAVVTSTEVVAFDALGRAGTDDFRAISRLIK